jgi:hypothetical protein
VAQRVSIAAASVTETPAVIRYRGDVRIVVEIPSWSPTKLTC